MKLHTLPTLSLALLLGLALGGCGDCGGGKTDGGNPDATVDGGTPDGGDDGGLPDGGDDGGMPDGGDDGGTDAGPPPFQIDRVMPARGPSAGGNRVTLSGRGFVFPFARLGEGVESQTAVLFGSNTAIEFTVVDDDTLEVFAPPGLVGARDIVVQNPNGEARCEGCYTYYTPVRADSLAPGESPVSGGALLALSGDGLVPGSRVLVGDRSAIDVQVQDPRLLTFIAPPAAGPGPVDVVVFNENGRATLRRSLHYFVAPRVDRLAPPVGRSTGGTVVQLEGAGLTGTTGVLLGGAPATGLTAIGDTTLLVTTPAGAAGSVVDLTLQHPRGDLTIPGAFTYVDPSDRSLSLLAVQPRRAPLAGGTEVELIGTGLDRPAPQVTFGGLPATGVTLVDGNRLRATVPAGAAVGPVDVQVRNDRGGALLPGALTYYEAVVVSAIDPVTGPDTGGTPVTITGSGFAAGVDLRIGALPVTDLVVVDANTLTATTAAGSPGASDVVVGLGSGLDRLEGVLAGGFTYQGALDLSRVEPERGAQAGGTLVSLYGSGFTTGSQVTFGLRTATVEALLGDAILTVRSPPGAPGLVDVSVSEGAGPALLPDAFQYYDPTNLRGGASGGPMAGTLNITVLDSMAGLPVQDAFVILGADPTTPFQGLTDTRGQITFSDPSLVKATDVTASAAGFASTTVSRVDTRDLTIFITPNEGEPGPPPVFAPPAFVGGSGEDGSLGRVCGFKLPPNRALMPGEREEARVYITSRSSFYLPPFGFPPSFQVVSQDCGTFTMASRAGNVAVYAFYGVASTEIDPTTGETLDSFEPHLMGITRGLEVPAIVPPVCTPNQACPGGFACGKSEFDPENPNDFGYCLCQVDAACGTGEFCNAAGGCQPPLEADVILSMHMDLDVPIRLVNAPQPAAGAIHVTYSYLELGGEGTVYVGEVVNQSDRFDFPRHPRLPGDGFVFLDMATSGGGYPLSLYFRRQIGDLALGVDLGPMQPMTHFISPVPGGSLVGGRVQWAYDGSPEPDLVQIDVEEPGFVPKPLWSIILPGSETSVEVPEQVLTVLRQSPMLQITATTALSPRFDYDHFSYSQLSALSWNSFTLDSQIFVVP
ncbi:MAG: IPT/TIG domain-containing protein [Deltaproteobacteria bacterium]|nr:IPT/TIG domain-containing protein [Deltaproteobacteria bacterium]